MCWHAYSSYIDQQRRLRKGKYLKKIISVNNCEIFLVAVDCLFSLYSQYSLCNIYIQSIQGFLLWGLKNEYIPVLGSSSGQWSKYSSYLCFSSKVIRNWTLMLFLISPLAVSQDISAMSHSLTSQQIIHLWLDTQSCLKKNQIHNVNKEKKNNKNMLQTFG